MHASVMPNMFACISGELGEQIGLRDGCSNHGRDTRGLKLRPLGLSNNKLPRNNVSVFRGLHARNRIHKAFVASLSAEINPRQHERTVKRLQVLYAMLSIIRQVHSDTFLRLLISGVHLHVAATLCHQHPYGCRRQGANTDVDGGVIASS